MARARVKKIDNLLWDISSGGFTGVAAGTSAGLVFIAVGTIPTTLLRMRGTFRAWIDGVQAPGGISLIQAGVIKVPEGSGTTVRYSPALDGNAPWVYYASGIVAYEEMVADAVAISGLELFNDHVDNKAMRRIRPDEEFQFVVSNTAISGAVAINAAYGIRFLQGF